MMSFVLLFIFTYASGYGLGKIDKKFLYYCALLVFVGISFHYWDEEGLLQAIIAFVVSLLGFFIGVAKTIDSQASGSTSSSRNSDRRDIPSYSNWNRIYDSLGDNYSNQLADTKEQAIQYHFRADYIKTKNSFEEDDKLRGICAYEKNPLLGFFEKFEKIIEYSEFVKCGTEGEFYLRYRHPNGDEWCYHHWPIRENTEWDIQMRKGEIRIGNTYLYYGLSGRPKFQYWKTYIDGKLVGFDPERGEV